MAADGKLLLRVLLFQSLVLGALCCSCIRTPPQDQFCRHEYVMKVRVKVRIRNDYMITHRIKIIKFFKGDDTKLKYKSGRHVLLTMNSACALSGMSDGDEYVIFGYNNEGDIYTNLCNGSKNWKFASRKLRNNLEKNTYKIACDCLNQEGPC